mgnify:CR=1 FL=1
MKELETEFDAIFKQVLDSKDYELANRLTKVFYGYGNARYKEGSDTIKKIYDIK